ncbi:MAG: hypothetical protein RLZZ299_954 [Pseudomonadota bacterium]
MRTSRLLGLAVLLLVPVVAGGCRKKAPVAEDVRQPPIPEPDAMQIAQVDPSTGVVDRAFDVEVIGSGFASGARVRFGDLPATRVRRVDANTLSVGVPPLGVGNWDVTVTNPDGGRATLRDALRIAAAPPAPPRRCASDAVPFAFDRADVDATARGSLEALARCLVETDGSVVVEGHCDSRGPTEYNLALGARRAEAVARVLSGLGVPVRHVRTVSYGEERPVVLGDNERAWAANRRVELVVEEER